ncbi:DUF222 domain-containing protein [Mycobacterium tuberculosis]|uniref:DUF222 domain-containing protein n=1 Tax=Mycobacterium tuberculosis TaxID=1773 RepID=UPI0032B3C500
MTKGPTGWQSIHRGAPMPMVRSGARSIGPSASSGRESQDGARSVAFRWLSTHTPLDARLSALAGTVCEHDPRGPQQRRADALGALAGGADRLASRGRADCAAVGSIEAPPR